MFSQISGLKSAVALGATALACVVVLLVQTGDVDATTWTPMDARSLVYHHSDLIMAGKITEKVEQSEPNATPSGPPIGIIDVSEVIYGPDALTKVRLILGSGRHGNEFVGGEEGIWFLKVVPNPSASPTEENALVVLVPDPPRVGIDIATGVFIAEHPSTFWKNANRVERSGRMTQLRRLVRSRVAADVKALSAALESAQSNLERAEAAAKAAGVD